MSLGTASKGNARVIERKEEAAWRQAAREARTDEEQLALLEERGKQGCKEWIRLSLRVNGPIANV